MGRRISLHWPHDPQTYSGISRVGRSHPGIQKAAHQASQTIWILGTG